MLKHIFAALHRSTSFRWTRSSSLLLGGFFALLFLIGYVWWPLVVAYASTYNPEISFWRQFDWLLLGNFLVMSVLIVANADLKLDLPIVLIGFAGGLVIESWGTQTLLWSYYTNERPPLWIIPAWPIASLAIDRLFRFLRRLTAWLPDQLFEFAYPIVFGLFFLSMAAFIAPTLDRSLTLTALFLCVFLVLTPFQSAPAPSARRIDLRRPMLLTFIAGAGLGFFLELWGTTRACWIYYTYQTPPYFAVLAHGMAAVAFWRVRELFWVFWPKLRQLARRQPVVLASNFNQGG